jgi:hypothetical protein
MILKDSWPLPATHSCNKRDRNPCQLNFVSGISFGKCDKYVFVLVLRVGVRLEMQKPATDKKDLPGAEISCQAYFA